MERLRKVNVESLSDEQLEIIEETLSKKMKEIVDRAIADANRYANVYGLEVLLGFELVKQGEANLIKDRLKQQTDSLE